MKRFVMSAAIAVMAFSMPALAEDTVETLKSKAAEQCLKEMGGEQAGEEEKKLCGCMVDSIVTVFGDDAPKMLQIIAAGLNPSDKAEIATLIGASEAEVDAFIAAADEKMDKVQEACVPAE